MTQKLPQPCKLKRLFIKRLQKGKLCKKKRLCPSQPAVLFVHFLRIIMPSEMRQPAFHLADLGKDGSYCACSAPRHIKAHFLWPLVLSSKLRAHIA